MSDLFDYDIDRIASTLLSLTKAFDCSLLEVWNKHTHPMIKENTTFEEVEIYIKSLGI